MWRLMGTLSAARYVRMTWCLARSMSPMCAIHRKCACMLIAPAVSISVTYLSKICLRGCGIGRFPAHPAVRSVICIATDDSSLYRIVSTPLRAAHTCRLCVAVLQSTAWASAAVRALLASLHGLQQAMASHKGPWLSKCASVLIKMLCLMSPVQDLCSPNGIRSGAHVVHKWMLYLPGSVKWQRLPMFWLVYQRHREGLTPAIRHVNCLSLLVW